MRPTLELVRDAEPDSTVAFRERVYRRGEQAESLRDVISLATAAAVGRRFLVLSVDDKPGRARRFPGISARSWKSFCRVLPGYLLKTVEPRLALSTHTIELDGALVGVVSFDSCEDPPYLLARRISSTMPAGGGWARRGVKLRRLVRKDLQWIFEQRFQRQEIGDVAVGFPGELPREELLPVMPLDARPSALAANKINRMLEANRVSRSSSAVPIRASRGSCMRAGAGPAQDTRDRVARQPGAGEAPGMLRSVLLNRRNRIPDRRQRRRRALGELTRSVPHLRNRVAASDSVRSAPARGLTPSMTYGN